MNPEAPPASSLRSYTTRVLIAVSIVALVFLAWRLLDVFMLLFGGIVLAAVLRSLAEFVQRHLKLAPQLALAGVVVLLLVVLVLGTWLIGDRAAEQLQGLRQALPRAIDATAGWLSTNAVGQTLIELWENAKSDGTALSRMATSFAGMTLNALSGALLIPVIGIYLAADPALYRRGLLRLVPLEERERVADALAATGHGLSRWLLGQAISMLVIGSLTALGLALLGMPLAIALGVITGLLGFVPFFGAITAGVLSVLLAFTQGPAQALYVALMFVGIQQFEELVLLPFIQRWAVRLPPVLGVVAAVIFGILFGPIGVLFATPLMVVVMILVQRLYVQAVAEAPGTRIAGISDQEKTHERHQTPRDPTTGRTSQAARRQDADLPGTAR